MGTRDKRIEDLQRRERQLADMLQRCEPRERLFVQSDLDDVRARLADASRKGRAA